MEAQTWRITEALASARALNEHIEELSHEDVIAALELESGSRRRQSMMDRLIARAVRLNELQYAKSLKEKYNVPSSIEGSVRCGSESC